MESFSMNYSVMDIVELIKLQALLSVSIKASLLTMYVCVTYLECLLTVNTTYNNTLVESEH